MWKIDRLESRKKGKTSKWATIPVLVSNGGSGRAKEEDYGRERRSYLRETQKKKQGPEFGTKTTLGTNPGRKRKVLI